MSEKKTPEQVIADTLRAELRLVLSLAGVLGKTDDPVSEADGIIDELGPILVEALRANGIETVVLPESDHGKHPWWSVSMLGEVEAQQIGQIGLFLGNGSYRTTSAGARQFAGALLAAARATEVS